MNRINLYHQSIRIILRNQADSGAYIASPNFPSYAYCWLRDGSFIAHAMDQVGKYDSARAFFRWGAQTIRRYTRKVDKILAKLEKGQSLDDSDYLHTRYTLSGKEATSSWWNFQLDGYGTWLWALGQHIALTGDVSLLNEVTESIQVTTRYLSALWMAPNYDCWEEYPQCLHPYTLAAIYAGLEAVNSLVVVDGHSETVADQIRLRRFVLACGVQNGHLVKHINQQGDIPAVVDASLVAVATPYHLISPFDPIMQATVTHIEADLHCPGEGVHRYPTDTYYGGGEWVLLTAWLGWHYAQIGEIARARTLLHWVEAQADVDGHMPEQMSGHLLAPDCYTKWEARWGPVAKPLLWSHAMYLILYQALKSVDGG